MASVFKALGSPIRLRLLAMMQARSGGEACVCDLVEYVGLSQPTVSHHLGVLMAAGLVRRERRGTWMWYALVPERLVAARELLA
jgi:ArsR family transcriptional regulator, arsenate/arsenite/antimonite-responsive transcriptional repressor